MLALPLSTLLIAYLVEILVLLGALANQLAEILEPTTRAGSVLAVRNRKSPGPSPLTAPRSQLMSSMPTCPRKGMRSAMRQARVHCNPVNKVEDDVV